MLHHLTQFLARNLKKVRFEEFPFANAITSILRMFGIRCLQCLQWKLLDGFRACDLHFVIEFSFSLNREPGNQSLCGGSGYKIEAGGLFRMASNRPAGSSITFFFHCNIVTSRPVSRGSEVDSTPTWLENFQVDSTLTWVATYSSRDLNNKVATLVWVTTSHWVTT